MTEAALPPVQSALRHLRRQALLADVTWFRRAAIVLFICMALADPISGHYSVPAVVALAVFAGYCAVAESVRHRAAFRRLDAWLTVLDLAAAGCVYLAGDRAGGPLFGLLVAIVLCGAACLSAGDGLAYTAVAGLLVLVAPMMGRWPATSGASHSVGTQAALLLVVGTGAVVARREGQSAAAARAAEPANPASTSALDLNGVSADFFSAASHGLRTPLAAAHAGLGMLEASAADRLRPDERALLANVRRNNERLIALVNDVLALKQAGARALDVAHDPLDLRVVVAAALPTVQPLIREKGQRLRVDLPESLPVAGDTRRLEHVVVNLLANANRHTPPGTSIALEGRRSGRRVVLTVSDDGPGIPATELDAIFRPFHRLDRADEGSGLGLAIARGIVEFHRGAIWAARRAEGGTTFTVALPVNGCGSCRSSC